MAPNEVALQTMTGPRLFVADPLAAAAEVAGEIAALVRAAQTEGRRFVLGCATGNTQHAVYSALVALHRGEGLSFQNVVTFNLDEYVGYAHGATHSFAAYMHEHLLRHVDIDPHNVYALRGDVGRDEMRAHCHAYEHAIEAAGGIDLQLLGVGRNGHVAFNEPGAPLDGRTRLVALDEHTRADARAGFDPDPVPREALTMGIATILAARRLRLLAFGAKKATAIRRAFTAPETSDVPVTALRAHSDFVVYADVAAVSELPDDVLNRTDC